ncbi:MAG: hypothetical protein LQ340_007088 [Diploschistes diacapsis]|nr:MAG: hypothetical protein LQ340_007088 [Diploschistes diacapsis]
MGNEQSKTIADGPPRTLKARTLDALADHIKDGNVKKVVLMVGAGISTAAGIPDFRSPGTGLYANLARLNLPYPEAVFDISFFRSNPLPFYTLAHELYPGKYRPTLAHCFIRLLHTKGILLKCFTQNIDCLEREAGVPDSLIVEAHGSFARQRCIECKTEFPDAEMRRCVMDREVPHCAVPQCNGLVKPDIVFFGEALPQAFFESLRIPAEADLAIVMGTSLKVHPFAMLPEMVRKGVPQVLINKERVGGLGSSPDDILMLGECDDGVRRLAKALGWVEELEALWREFHPDGWIREKEKWNKMDQEGEGYESIEKAKVKKDEALNEEIEQLTRKVDESLKLTGEYRIAVSKELEKSKVRPAEDLSSNDSNSEKPAWSLTGSTDSKKLHAEPDKETASGSELQHVFPHLDSKASL